jgi:hypothetical protein
MRRRLFNDSFYSIPSTHMNDPYMNGEYISTLSNSAALNGKQVGVRDDRLLGF